MYLLPPVAGLHDFGGTNNSEILVNIYHTTRRNNLEDNHLYTTGVNIRKQFVYRCKY
jgi:hypothetical protein